MIKESVICDNCGVELIEDSNYPHKYVLELSVIDTIRNSGNVQFLVAMFPPFEGKKHFCGKNCLSEWLKD